MNIEDKIKKTSKKMSKDIKEPKLKIKMTSKDKEWMNRINNLSEINQKIEDEDKITKLKENRQNKLMEKFGNQKILDTLKKNEKEKLIRNKKEDGNKIPVSSTKKEIVSKDRIELEREKVALERERIAYQKQKFDLDQKLGEIRFRKAELESVEREARYLSQLQATPLHFRGKTAECMWVVRLARRLDMDPFMVMNNIYFMHGRVGYSSSFMIGVVNQCGLFSNLEFEYNGTGESRSCVAKAKCLKTKRTLSSIPVSIKMAREEGWSLTRGSKWKTMPDLMLQYRAAAFFCRAFAPQFLMGLAKEELEDINNISKNK
jgi:hypothetical protein